MSIYKKYKYVLSHEKRAQEIFCSCTRKLYNRFSPVAWLFELSLGPAKNQPNRFRLQKSSTNKTRTE